MKKVLVLTAAVAAFGLMSFAKPADTTVKGYIMDKGCSTKASMKGNTTCAQDCVKKGDTAVLVADGADGKVYAIANQDKVKSVLGQHVTAKGSVDGDTITITSASKSSAPAAK